MKLEQVDPKKATAVTAALAGGAGVLAGAMSSAALVSSSFTNIIDYFSDIPEVKPKLPWPKIVIKALSIVVLLAVICVLIIFRYKILPYLIPTQREVEPPVEFQKHFQTVLDVLIVLFTLCLVGGPIFEFLTILYALITLFSYIFLIVIFFGIIIGILKLQYVPTMTAKLIVSLLMNQYNPYPEQKQYSSMYLDLIQYNLECCGVSEPKGAIERYQIHSVF